MGFVDSTVNSFWSSIDLNGPALVVTHIALSNGISDNVYEP